MGLEERAQTKDIDGVIYKVTPLRAAVGLPMLIKLTKAVSPLMAASVRAGVGMAAASVLEVVPAALDEKMVTDFAREFGDSSFYKDGDKWIPLVSSNQDLHFAANYSSLARWLYFCVEVNFGGFFSGMSADLATTMKAAPAKAA